MLFDKGLPRNDPRYSGAAMIVLILARSQKVASFLDRTQKLASHVDERLGFGQVRSKVVVLRTFV